MITTSSGVYRLQTIILQDPTRSLPIGPGTFPFGNGGPQQEARAYSQRWRGPDPINETVARGMPVLPFGQGTFPLGGGTTAQTADLIVEAWPVYEPYSLILQPFDRMRQHLDFLVAPSAFFGNPIQTATIAGWRGLPEVWIMERSPDWAVLESFTPPVAPDAPPWLSMWAPAQLQVPTRPAGQYVLLYEPTYFETLVEAPPIGDVVNTLAKQLVAEWSAYAPPWLNLQRAPLLAGQLAPPRTDPPPIGGWSQRWVQWLYARERYDVVLQRLAQLKPPGAEPPLGDWILNQQGIYEASQVTAPYSLILESVAKTGPFLQSGPQAPPLGNPWWWIQMLYWLRRGPDPALPHYWFARWATRTDLLNNPPPPPVPGTRRMTPAQLRRLRLLGIYPGLT
jgi:hypothetical protein